MVVNELGLYCLSCLLVYPEINRIEEPLIISRTQEEKTDEREVEPGRV